MDEHITMKRRIGEGFLPPPVEVEESPPNYLMKKKAISATDLSRYHGDISLNEKGKMTGTYQLEDGCIVKYSLTLQQPTSQYLVRGSISLLDPSSGAVLKIKDRSGIATKPAKNHKATDDAQEDGSAETNNQAQSKSVIKDARVAVVSDSSDPENLRKIISEKAKALCNQYQLLLLDSADKSVPTERMTFSLAIALMSANYTKSSSKNPETQHRKELRLKRMANVLPKAEIGKLSLNDVKMACNELGCQWRTYVKEACRFLDFILQMRRDSSGYNVFSEYLRRNPARTKRDTLRLQKDASNSDILSLKEEKTLNQIISDGVDNGLLMGVLLIKEAGFSSTEACALLWKHVLPVADAPDALLIRYRRNEIAGAVHDYSFPITGFPVEILLARKNWLLNQGFSEEKIADMHVASEQKDPSIPLAPRVLTATCRNLLHNAGVGYSTLAGLTDYQQGAGITLLLQTFQHHLENVCRLKNDPAAVLFLQHKSLVNMLQANHYRCFTDTTARHYLITALRRDKRFLKEERHAKCIKRKKKQSGEQIEIYPESSKYRTHATFRAHLEPGQSVMISAPNGCFVAVKNLTTA